MTLPQIDIGEVISALQGFNRRLTRSFAVVILVLMMLVLFIGGLYFKGVMEREEHTLSTILTRVLASSVTHVSFSGKYHAQLLLNDVHNDQPDIRTLAVTDGAAVVLAASDRGLLDRKLEGDRLQMAAQVLSGQVQSASRRYLLNGEPLLEVTLPYRGGFDHSLQGVVQVGISLQSRDLALHNGMLYMSLLVFLLLGIGIYLTRRLGHFYAAPVQSLSSYMAATLQAMPDKLFELDFEGRYLQVVAQREELLPARREELLGRTIHQVLTADAAAVVEQALREADRRGESNGWQFALPLAQGTRWFELSVARKPTERGELRRFIVLSRDITDRKQTERELDLYANVFKHSGEAIMVTDRDNRILSVNPALTRLTGYSAEELLGKNPKFLSSGHTPWETYRQMWDGLLNKGYWQGELWDRRKNGETYPKWVSISVIRNPQGEVTNHIASYTDITERKMAEERIDYIAHHDVLTGLLNRYSLEERLEQAILNSRRDETQLAVMFLDMDRFKDINDSMGHHCGDAMLIEIGKRIKGRVRESDIVARLGGDEFVIVLPSVDSDNAVAGLARDITELLGRPYQLEDKVLHSTPSIGISLFPGDGDSVELLMKHADTAMYHAKERGRNNFQFFTAEMNRAIEDRLMLENELRTALAQSQFELHYQPICYPDGRWAGVEALIRWCHPERGMVPPDRFIPVAEESGIIQPLGRWVIEEACRQAMAWREAGIQPLQVSVNLSLHQLQEPDFLAQVEAILQRHAIEENQIKFEITESAAMTNPQQAIEQLHAFRKLGIGLAIDDFGTGYSSLAYLKRLPIDTLKLDRAFVDDIEEDGNDAEISAATLALAHNLGLRVVAEGVENEQQRNFLVEHQCDYLQGYLFSRPLPAAEISRRWHEQPAAE